MTLAKNWLVVAQRLQTWLLLDRRSLKCLSFSLLCHTVMIGVWLVLTSPMQGIPDSELIAVGVVTESSFDNRQVADDNVTDPTHPDVPVPDDQEVDPPTTQPTDQAKELLQNLPQDHPELQEYLKEQEQKIVAKQRRAADLNQQQSKVQQRMTERSRYGTLAPRTFYGIKVFERHVLFVLDISGSMDIGEAQIQLKNAYHALNEKESFNILAYNETVFRWKDVLLPATGPNRDSADAWIKQLPSGGSTNTHDALQTAFGIAEKSGGFEAIYFVSDGLPTCGTVINPVQILTAVVKWNRQQQVVIHTIGIGPHQDRTFLSGLAEQNHGRYHVR